VEIKLKLAAQYQRFAAQLSNMEQTALNKANPKVLAKVLRNLKVKTKRAAAEHYGAAQKVFSTRVNSYFSKNRQVGELWVGLNSVDLYKLGKAKQIGPGVRVNNIYKAPAFIQTVRRGQVAQKTSIWRRLNKIKIEKVKVELAELNAVIEKIAKQYGLRQYRELLEQAMLLELLKIK